MRRSTHSAGFTAIEMVSAITILMLIMAAVATIFSKSNDLWASSGGGRSPDALGAPRAGPDSAGHALCGCGGGAALRDWSERHH
jgi:hypothetical protein